MFDIIKGEGGYIILCFNPPYLKSIYKFVSKLNRR